jgi:hypothetical protein
LVSDAVDDGGLLVSVGLDEAGLWLGGAEDPGAVLTPGAGAIGPPPDV